MLQVKNIIFEFYVSGDIPEAMLALEETGYPGLHHYFVKKLVTTALDRRDRDRELACVLLSSLFGEVSACPVRLRPGRRIVVGTNLQFDVDFA